MKIAVIGVGNVGGTLGPVWAKAGHEITYGVRDPGSEKVQTLLENSGQNARAAGVAEAAAGADIVIFATPWSATQDAVRTAGTLEGKIVVDCTNPIAPDLKGLSIGTTTSAGEQVAQVRVASQAKVGFYSPDELMGGEATQGRQFVRMWEMSDCSMAWRTSLTSKRPSSIPRRSITRT